MSTLDLDKRKVFSILERKVRDLKLSSNGGVVKIKISLLKDLHKDGISLVKNQGSLDDIFLFIEEQTNRRFVYEVGSERRIAEIYQEKKYEDEKLVDVSDIEVHDDVYTFIFDPSVAMIEPNKLLDRSEVFYITQDGSDYYFESKLLDLGKTSKYYKVFDALYSIVPDGGLALYKDLIVEVKKRERSRRNVDDKSVKKFIQDNLTGIQNGFIHKAKVIPKSFPNGSVLIKTQRKVGIQFTNRK
jgi:hypothetical protein